MKKIARIFGKKCEENSAESGSINDILPNVISKIKEYDIKDIFVTRDTHEARFR